MKNQFQKHNFNSRTLNNEKQNDNDSGEIESSLENDDINNDNEEIQKKANNEDEIISDDEKFSNEEDSVDEDSVDEGNNNPKKSLVSKLMKKPQTYLFLTIFVTVITIILFTVAIFRNNLTDYPPNMLCSGPSKLEKITVITTDSEGKPIINYNFYRYISAKLLSDLGATTNEKHINPYQAQGIAVVSKLLNQNYKPEILESNLAKLKEWCDPNNDEDIKMLCPYLIEDDLEVIIVADDLFPGSSCNLFTGCYHWRNEGYDLAFGIKDGECISEDQSTQSRDTNSVKTKYCVVNKNLDENKIKEFEEEGYEFKKENDLLYLLVSAKRTLEDPIKTEDKNFVIAASEAIAGVLMVNLDGSPALTEYNTESSCSAGENVMCTGNSSSFTDYSAFGQANYKNWPVHKILSYWYSYYFSSWSEFGRNNCNLYVKQGIGGTQALNLEEGTDIKARPNTTPGYVNELPDFNYVKDQGASLLSIFADIKNEENQKIAEKLEIPIEEIKEVTKEDIRNDFNRAIMNGVKSKGVGTGEGVAMAAIVLANYMETENYRLPYTFGGGAPVDSSQHVYGKKHPKVYGIHPSWGKKVEDNDSYWSQEATAAWEQTEPIWKPYLREVHHYIPLGMDCLGFVEWALKNGGIDGNILYETRVNSYYGNGNMSRTYEELEGHTNLGWFGDVLWRSAGGKSKTPHGKLVIGPVYDINNVLIGNRIAESSGTYYGLRISVISVVTGERMRAIEISSTNPDTGEKVIEGYTYEVSLKKDPEASPYAVIDLSGCYNQTNPSICSLDTEENFYKGVITEDKYDDYDTEIDYEYATQP